MRRLIGLAATVSALGLPGCDGTGFNVNLKGIAGSGTIREEPRLVAAFTKVAIGSTIRAVVTIGDPASVVLSGDDNLVPLIRTEVRDGRLVADVAPGNSIRPNKPLTLTIVVPRLDRVEAEGAAVVEASPGEVEGFRVEARGASSATIKGLSTSGTLALVAEGASRIKVDGRAKAVELGASGASTVDASGVVASSAKASIDGASRGEASASDSVDGQVSGAGSLVIRGSPRTRNVWTNGVGSVRYP